MPQKDDYNWRLTPTEELFQAIPTDNTETTKPETILSNRILKCLRENKTLDPETQINLTHMLAENLINNKPYPLKDFDILYESLCADYHYYDAYEHLKGFTEGMLYGILMFADNLDDLLSSQSEYFLPPAALTYPDIILTMLEHTTTDIAKITNILNTDQKTIITAFTTLLAERIIIQNIMGRKRYFLLSTRGEKFAIKLKNMALHAIAETDTEEDAISLLSDMADFDITTKTTSIPNCIKLLHPTVI